MAQNNELSRRTFLKGAAAGVAAVGLSTVLPAVPAQAAPGPKGPDVKEKLVKKVTPLKIQTFPCKTTEEFTELFRKQEAAAKTKEQIYYHPYTGLFHETVTSDKLSSDREFYTYIADGTIHCCSSVFVAMPEKADPAAWLVQSGWTALADEYRFLLHAMVPAANKKWGAEAEETEYLTQCLALGIKTVNYSPYTGNYYFVGYGVGGRLMQQYLMTRPEDVAGMVVVDGSDIPEAYLKKMAQTPAIAVEKTVNTVQVPVWLVQKAEDKKVKKVIDYWMTANDSEAEAVTVNSYPNTVCYNQNMLSVDHFYNDYPIARVQITSGNINPLDQNFNRIVWETFLKKNMRYNALQGKDLRPAIDWEKLGITKEWRVVDGKHRYWLEFVPQTVKDHPEKAVPMVFAMHGAGQCGEAYCPYSEWFKVAEEAGFIVTFPTAYPFSENNGMARPIHNDCWQEDGIRPSDLNFWRFMIDDVKSRWNIDAGRVYATGHSNGGNSSAMIAGEMADVVTACGISAGRYRYWNGKVTEEVSSLHPMATDTNGLKTPVMQLCGTKDGGAYRSASMTSTMMYWLEKDGCKDLTKPLKYKAGTYHYQVWSDEAGIPWVYYVIIENKPHTTVPMESRTFYYEFMSKYYRDSNGVIHYCEDDSIIDH